MRIALISDIHGNEIAFRAVIRDIKHIGVDQIVCLGDIATLGPFPNSVVHMLKDLDCSCILGNHDDFLLDQNLIHPYTEAPAIIEAVDWCRDQFSKNDFDFIRSFQSCLEINCYKENRLFIFHGSPRSDMESILSTTQSYEFEQMLDGKSATVLSCACGHTYSNAASIQGDTHHKSGECWASIQRICSRTATRNNGSFGICYF